MNEGLKVLFELFVTVVAVMAGILLVKLAASYLPSNGYLGAAKGLVNAV